MVTGELFGKTKHVFGNHVSNCWEIVPYEISGVSCQNGGHFADDPKGISSAIGFCTK